MAKTIAYIRVSTDKQDVNNQRLEVLDYAHKNDFRVDDFIEIEISSRKSQKRRRIEELLDRLGQGDTLIVSELSRLGRSTSEVIDLVNHLIQQKVNLIVIKQSLRIAARMDMQTKMIVTMFSLFAELERDIISERTRSALAGKKANGIKLGKPKGTIQTSKLDGKQDAIRELLKHRVSKSAIARMMGTSRTNLTQYIQRRDLC
jgi:putative DNA-invertase from lambdoid prophage Rac